MKAFLRGVALALALSALPGMAAAQGEEAESGETAAEERAMAFEASEGAQTENIPGGALMIAAYGVVWLLVLGYVVSLGYRQARTSGDIERLRRDLKAVEEKAAED
jgi:CcmD family protein